MVLNHAVGDAQAQSRAVADALGREERIEDLGEDFVGDPAAVVGHLDNDLAPRVSVVIVIRPSSRWVDSMACMALTRRFKKTWLSCAAEPATRGRSPRCSSRVMLRRSRRPRIISTAVLERLMNIGLVDRGAVEPGEAAEVLHDVGHALDALPRAAQDLAHVLLDIGQVELIGKPGDLPGQSGWLTASESSAFS